MSLNAIAGTTDRVLTTGALGLGNAFTIMQWVYPTSNGNGNGSITQPTTTSNIGRIRRVGTGGDISVLVARTSVPTQYETNDTPWSTLNKWYFTVVTYDESGGAGEVANIYVGDLTTLAVERSYGVAIDGSGATIGESGGAAICNSNSTTTQGFGGRVAFTAAYSRVMSLNEIRTHQFFPRVASNCRLFMVLGWNGTGTQADWSGLKNHGTVTGATVAAHVPLRPLVSLAGGIRVALVAALAPTLRTVRGITRLA